jgi:hypothetical protein
MSEQPTVGRIVHFVAGVGHCRPAIVTAHFGATMSLTIFDAAGRIRSAVAPSRPGRMWHWPEREQELEAERKKVLDRLLGAAARIEAIGAEEAAPSVQRRQVITVDDVVGEVERRASRLGDSASYSAAYALRSLVDWLNEPVEPAP